MTPAEEAAYENGKRAAWLGLMRAAIQNLDGADRDLARLTLERAEAVNALRRVCTEYGDNDWPDNLHLADVIDKHLERCLQK